MRITPRRVWLAAALLLYLALACYQLGLPGLHYDEAKEAGLNAMQLLTGAQVTPFRDAALTLGGLKLPLMVQDYIGALNVYLALPLLALSGIGVPNLRLLPVLEGLAGLILLERAVSEWWAWRVGDCRHAARHAVGVTYGEGRHVADVTYEGDSPAHTPISLAGLFTVTLLAASPSYVFWARQGIFVTNLLLPWTFLCLWQGVRWLRGGRGAALLLSALGGGLALYAKLSAYWVVVPFTLLAGGWWLLCRLRARQARTPTLQACSPLRPATLILAAAAFLLPLLPLLAFNLQTGGTLLSIGGNLGRSYYGIDNANLPANAALRWDQVVQVLRGDQFWYLGAVYANAAAPWLALLAVLGGLWRNRRAVLPPLVLVGAAFAASLFTVSDLFVTHYVLLQPLLVALAALALAVWVDNPTALETPPVETGGHPKQNRLKPVGEPARAAFPNPLQWVLPATSRRFQPAAAAVAGVLIVWLALDLTAGLRYHAALTRSGGLADHSDASYHLAYHLQYNGMGAPIALDWGIDAPVRYLTRGAVTPIEIFGYASPDAPDDQFGARLAPFLQNPANRYLLHTPQSTVFAGRREAFLAAVQAGGLQATLEQMFSQRDGLPLYEIWYVNAP